jgi:hypothetical protein
MNEKNLEKGKATQFRSGDEAVKSGKKGGVASGVARREKKALKTTLEMLLSMPIEDGKLEDVDKVKSLASLGGKNISVQEAIVLKALQLALNGDIKAFNAIADILKQGTSESDTVEPDGFIESIEEAAKTVWQCE